ncbi:MAG: S9 family peptidase [Haliscomenobacter sp.]|nr:S9 family peptidase [Haliscomenobacter sp.]
MKSTPPQANSIPHSLSIHGETRIDPYFWLNQRENPAVLEYLQEENAYLESQLAHTKPLQEKIFQEITGRIKQEDQSVPYLENGYYYLTRFESGKEYPIYSRKKGSLDAEEEVLLNVNELASGHAYFSVGDKAVSPNNRFLAFGEDTLSRRIYTLRFKDLATGEFLPEQIPNTTGLAAWANDNSHVFYTAKDPQTLRGYKIMRHQLGSPIETDQEVYREEEETYDTFVYHSKSRKYLIILSSQTISQEYRILEADNPTGAFEVFHPRERGLEYSIEHFDDRFYIRTNLQARNFRLMVCPENSTNKSFWQEVVPHREDTLLEDLEVFKGFLALSERNQGITQIRIISFSGEDHYISFPEEVYMAYTSINMEFDRELLRLGYQSLTTPVTTFDYNMRTRELTLLKQEEVLGGFDKANYHAERLHAVARDGAKIPLSVVYRKGFRKDGTQPVLLYGYGSYGFSMEPYFSAARISLLDRGFAFAIAHVRGGEDLGRAWYEQGKLLHKKNTFYDFIDCAEYLLHHHYTSRNHLYAMGGSAGGLLIGAVVNMRPEIWKGVVAVVPFVDVVTTMLDQSIPLTTFEYDEWGDPRSKEYYDYMYSYSPYDNVEKKAYPAMLVITGLHDSQVQYWEPAKWVAKLRAYKTNDEPLLLFTNLDTGHSGASGRFERYRETALEYSFLLDLEGIRD